MVLIAQAVNPLRKPAREKRVHRYSKKIPGEQIQIDTCKITHGLHQYTALDDCTRYQFLEIYSRRTAQNTLDFMEKVVEEMPFPIQLIQTDLGQNFFVNNVQNWFMKYCIKFRSVKPRSPPI